MGLILGTHRDWKPPMIETRLLFAFLLGCLGLGCKGKEETHLLTGHVSNGGRTVGNVTLSVVGPAGEEASVLVNESGEYRIENPPKGPLKFKMTGFAPPPPPGLDAAHPLGDARIPRRYHTTENDLVFDYTGGQQKYDIHLKQ